MLAPNTENTPLAMAIGGLALLGSVAGCKSDPAVEGKVPADGCYVQLYEDDDYQGESWVITGPNELETLAKWNDKADSLIVGPNAWVTAFYEREFQGPKLYFGPGSRVPSLDGREVEGNEAGDDVESIRISREKPPSWKP